MGSVCFLVKLWGRKIGHLGNVESTENKKVRPSEGELEVGRRDRVSF